MESCEPSLLYTVKTWQYFKGRNQTFCIGFQTIYWFLFCIWLVREWRVFSEPIMEQSKAKPKQPWTLFDIHNENCLKRIYETIKYNTLHLNTVVQLQHAPCSRIQPVHLSRVWRSQSSHQSPSGRPVHRKYRLASWRGYQGDGASQEERWIDDQSPVKKWQSWLPFISSIILKHVACGLDQYYPRC